MTLIAPTRTEVADRVRPALDLPDGFTWRRAITVRTPAGRSTRAMVVFRPALARERIDAYARLADRETRETGERGEDLRGEGLLDDDEGESEESGAADPLAVEQAENELLVGHVVSLGGHRLTLGSASRLLPDVKQAVLELVLGYSSAAEARDLQRLAIGVRLVTMHPELARRPCSECVSNLYDDRPPDQFAEKPLERAGRVVLRVVGKPPCSFCPKQPTGVKLEDRRPETALELNDRGWRALSHYRECRSVGAFPDDPIVKQNASIIRAAEDVAEQLRSIRVAMAGRGVG